MKAVNVVLHEAHARSLASWVERLIERIKNHIKKHAVLKIKAEATIKMRALNKGMEEEMGCEFMNQLTNILGITPEGSAQIFLDNYDKELTEMQTELDMWLEIRKQIKDQIVSEEPTHADHLNMDK